VWFILRLRINDAIELKMEDPTRNIKAIAEIIYSKIPDKHQDQSGNSISSISTRLYHVDESPIVGEYGEQLKIYLLDKEPSDTRIMEHRPHASWLQQIRKNLTSE